jgi:hypothetical protein
MKDVDQARRNVLKTIRAAVRLKYSILADNELHIVLPKAQEKFDAAVLRGEIPDPLEIKSALHV